MIKTNHLKCYSIENSILNKSFVSTSKKRSVAQCFVERRQNSTDIPVLLIYTIKQSETAIDIQQLSAIPDEEEVLILPLSVFKVKTVSNQTGLTVIHLEECQSKIDYETIELPEMANLPNKTKKKRRVAKSKLCQAIVAVSVIIGLIMTAYLTIKPVEGKVTNYEENAISVVGSNGSGNQTNQLAGGCGISIDDDEIIIVADTGNHRIMRWIEGNKQGTIVAGGHGPGNKSNQLYYPEDVALDQQKNLYVVDSWNSRIQKFEFRSA